MIHEFSEKLFNELKDGLKVITLQDYQPKIKLREQSLLIAAAMAELYDFIQAHPFESLQDEIHFYKDIYPKFASLKVYYRERYDLMRSLPFGTKRDKKCYFKLKLNRIACFFKCYRFYYDYDQTGACELDELFYTAVADPNHVLQPVLLVNDVSKGTAMAILLAKFLAFERLRNDILSLLHGLEPAPVLSATTIDANGQLQSPFKWIGEIIHLIELAHGIYLTKQIDTEETGIVEFFARLGEFFGVNLRVPKRGFDDLKARKTMSKTQFTDLMRSAILTKMDEDDAYDAEKRKGKSGHF